MMRFLKPLVQLSLGAEPSLYRDRRSPEI